MREVLYPAALLHQTLQALIDWAAVVDQDDVPGWTWHPLTLDVNAAAAKLAADLLVYGEHHAACYRGAAVLEDAIRTVLNLARTRGPRHIDPAAPATTTEEEAWDEYDLARLSRDMAAETRQMWKQARTVAQRQALRTGTWMSMLREPREPKPETSPRPNGSAPGATGPTG